MLLFFSLHWLKSILNLNSQIRTFKNCLKANLGNKLLTGSLSLRLNTEATLGKNLIHDFPSGPLHDTRVKNLEGLSSIKKKRSLLEDQLQFLPRTSPRSTLNAKTARVMWHPPLDWLLWTTTLATCSLECQDYEEIVISSLLFLLCLEQHLVHKRHTTNIC